VAELIHQFRDPIRAAAGVSYVVQAWGATDRGWHGWLVFIAADGSILRTGRLIARRNREHLRRWAMRLPIAALDDALAHAVPTSTELPAA